MGKLTGNKILSLLLALCLMLGLLPGMTLTARAAGTADELVDTINAVSGLIATKTDSATVTVTGTATLSNVLNLNIDDGIRVVWQADVTGNGMSDVIMLEGEGIFEVASGAKITAPGSGYAVRGFESASSTILVSGGEVSSTGDARGIDTRGQLTITGGTVSCSQSWAIRGYQSSNITISGGILKSDNTYGSLTYGTITTSGKLTIEGGEILAKGEYIAILFSGTGEILTVSGGIITAEEGSAISLIGARGAIMGGTISATGVNGNSLLIKTGCIAYREGTLGSGGIAIQDLGCTVKVAVGTTAADAGSATDLTADPVGSAVWAVESGVSGIRYTNGVNTGFIAFPGVTVTVPTNITASFTDANFLAAVRTALVKGPTDPIYDTDVAAVTQLDVDDANIASLAGIEHFTALEELNCNYNRLTALPVLPASLKRLYCSGNQLTALPTLPTGLTSLECSSNQLTALPTLPTGLTYLSCPYNRLTSLPATLPASLTELRCYNNQLTSLPATLPASLTELYCYNNLLTSLPDLSALVGLTYLGCSSNQLTALPATLPASLTELNCYSNQLAALPDLSALSGLFRLLCNNNRLTALDVTGLNSLTQLNCSYNYIASESAVTGFNGTWDDVSFFFTPQHAANFHSASGITGLQYTATVGVPLTLTGTVLPTDATNKTIDWSVYDANGTGAQITGNIFTATMPGVAWLRGGVTNGLSDGNTFEYSYWITVNAAGVTPPGNTVPTAPQNLTATPGNGQVTLSWAAPATSGGAAISKYEVSSDNGGTWVTASGSTGHTFTVLTNGQSYAFKVRAVNSVGNGAEASVTATPSSGGGDPVNPGGGGGGGGAAPAQTAPAANGAVKVEYSQSGGAVTLSLPDNKLNEIIGASKGTATLDLSGVKNTTSAVLPKAALGKLAGAGLNVALKLPQGTLTLDEKAAASLASQASGANVSVQLNQTAPSSLNSAQREAIKDGDLVFNISVTSGTQNITTFGGTLTVTVPYDGPLPAGVWYLNSAGELEKLDCVYNAATKTVSFTLSHLSLYVVGQDKSAPPSPAWINPFADVSQGDWFYDAVKHAHQNGLFSGTTATTFSPGTSMTRVMFVTVLARLDGIDLSGGETWYAKAVEWAKTNGISDGTNLDSPITREQIAVMLYNYMNYKGYTVPSGSAAAFADEDSISSWALDAVNAIRKMGIVSGKPGNLYDPQGVATRAEVATIFARFVEAQAK